MGYVDVAPALAAKGYRVVVPFLRGHGMTTCCESSTGLCNSDRDIGPNAVAVKGL